MRAEVGERAVERRMKTTVNTVNRQHSADRVEHRMMTAFPSAQTARRYGVARNHALRVWCTCMAGQRSAPGDLPSGVYHDPARPASSVEADPRRLGGWDWLGVVDVRIENSALDLWRRHVEEAEHR